MMKRVLLIYVFLLHVRRPAALDVVRSTRNGDVLGVRRHFADRYIGISNIDTFLGVPYAAPPVGEFRWKAPRTAARWHRRLNATRHGPICPQPEHSFHPDLVERNQDEDCLYLDIYTPHQEISEPYPVMMYVHGGSYEVGAGRLITGEALAQFGVVVILINYRLGALGYLSSGDENISGNFGLHDQVAALRWIRDNVASFGGDPSRVTVFGHSAGSASVGMLLVVPAAAGLFHRVIAQSGVAIAAYGCYPPSFDRRDYIRQVARIFRCPGPTSGVIAACLRRVPWRDIIEQRAKFPRFDPIDPEFRPVIDDVLLHALPYNTFKSGQHHRVPVMTGTVSTEFGNYFDGGIRHKAALDEALDSHIDKYFRQNQLLIDLIHFQYRNWQVHPLDSGASRYDRGNLLSDMQMVAPTAEFSEMLAGHGGAPVFQYHFDVPQSYHSVELGYVFGDPFTGQISDELIEHRSVPRTYDEAQRHLTELVMRLWSNFAKSGNPTPEGFEPLTVRWRNSSASGGDYLHITLNRTRMRRHLRRKWVSFWNDQMVGVQRHLRDLQFADRTNNFRFWAMTSAIAILAVLVLVLLFCVLKMKQKHSRATAL